MQESSGSLRKFQNWRQDYLMSLNELSMFAGDVWRLPVQLEITGLGPSGVLCGRLFAARAYVGRASPLSVRGHVCLHVLARCVLLCLRLLRRNAPPRLGGWFLSAAKQAFKEHHWNPPHPVVTFLPHYGCLASPRSARDHQLGPARRLLPLDGGAVHLVRKLPLDDQHVATIDIVDDVVLSRLVEGHLEALGRLGEAQRLTGLATLL